MANVTPPPEDTIGIGAEGILVKSTWFGRPCLIKKRLPKAYRLPALDSMLRKQRTVLEVRALIDAKECGVPTPAIFEADPDAGSIIMDFIEGSTLRILLQSMRQEEIHAKFMTVGEYVGMLHKGGLIHGDLTTSNILVTPQDTLVFIDFGLSQRSDSLEDQGVDAHLLKRVLTSTHAAIWEDAYKAFLLGYNKTGPHSAKAIDARVSAIELRGRYVKKEERRKRFY
jgi:TP53 regulating kinase-like protein